jgi:hypothetical protein
MGIENLIAARRLSYRAWAEFAIWEQRYDDVIPSRATGIPRLMRSMEEGGLDLAFIGRHGRPVAVLVSLDHYRDLLLGVSDGD